MKRVFFGVLCLLLCLPLAAQGTTPTAQQALNDGNRLRAQGQLDEAQKAYEVALKLASKSDERGQALLGLASLCQARRDTLGALSYYNQALALPQLPTELKQTALYQTASLQRSLGALKAARTTFNRLLSDLAGDVDQRIAITLELANLDLAEKQPTAAIQRLKKLLPAAVKSKRLADVYTAIVQAQAQGGDFKGALATAHAGWERLPEHFEIMLPLVSALEAKGKLSEAAAAMQEVLLHRPQDTDLFRTLYEYEKQAGTLPALMMWLNKQAQAHPLDILWLEHLAHLQEWEEDNQEALRTHEQIVGRKPTDVQVLQNAAQAALQAKSYESASKWLEQAINLDPNNQKLIVMVGEIQLQQGHPDQALTIWKQYLRYKPQDAQTVQTLGEILLQHDLTQEALAVYLEARKASNTPAAYALNLGQVYEKLQNYTQAVSEYAIAAEEPERSVEALAGMRLSRLAEDDATRPKVLAVLQGLRDKGSNSTEILTTLLYAQVLSGVDSGVALDQLTKAAQPETIVPLLSKVAARLESTGQTAVAAQCYLRLLQEPLTPDYGAALAIHASDLQTQSGEWRKAIATLKQVKLAELGPELRARVLLQLGELLLRPGKQPANALGAFNQVIEQQPSGNLSLSARWGEADVAFALGKYDMALVQYRRLLEETTAQGNETSTGQPARRVMWPGPDFVDYQTAEALFRQGKVDEAVAAFHKLTKDHSNSQYANEASQRVLLITRLDKNTQSMAAYRQALALFDRGEAEQAMALLQPLTTTLEGDVALLLLGQIQHWQGQREAAVQSYQQVADKFGDSPLASEALFTAAMIVAQTDKPGAQERLQAILDRYPKAPQADQARLVLNAWRKGPAEK